MIVEDSETGAAIRSTKKLEENPWASERFGRRATAKSVSPQQHVVGNY